MLQGQYGILSAQGYPRSVKEHRSAQIEVLGGPVNLSAQRPDGKWRGMAVAVGQGDWYCQIGCVLRNITDR